MMGPIKNFVKGVMSPYLYGRLSYSQEGEDLVVDRLIEGKKAGFYIEVGCHHPFRFSNTYFFYKRGWSGVCIDALPGTRKLFRRWRKRDTVIEEGVAISESTLTYFMFNEPALNTFDKSLADEREKIQGCFLIDEKRVRVRPLSLLLSELNIKDPIDLLSVDVEGLDLEVLQSNDWERYRPKIVVVEALDRGVEMVDDVIFIYLKEVGYKFYAKTGNSLVFVVEVN